MNYYSHYNYVNKLFIGLIRYICFFFFPYIVSFVCGKKHECFMFLYSTSQTDMIKRTAFRENGVSHWCSTVLIITALLH